jgi:hypothetical protein
VERSRELGENTPYTLHVTWSKRLEVYS